MGYFTTSLRVFFKVNGNNQTTEKVYAFLKEIGFEKDEAEQKINELLDKGDLTRPGSGILRSESQFMGDQQ